MLKNNAVLNLFINKIKLSINIQKINPINHNNLSIYLYINNINILIHNKKII